MSVGENNWEICCGALGAPIAPRGSWTELLWLEHTEAVSPPQALSITHGLSIRATRPWGEWIRGLSRSRDVVCSLPNMIQQHSVSRSESREYNQEDGWRRTRPAAQEKMCYFYNNNTFIILEGGAEVFQSGKTQRGLCWLWAASDRGYKRLFMFSTLASIQTSPDSSLWFTLAFTPFTVQYVVNPKKPVKLKASGCARLVSWTPPHNWLLFNDAELGSRNVSSHIWRLADCLWNVRRVWLPWLPFVSSVSLLLHWFTKSR